MKAGSQNHEATEQKWRVPRFSFPALTGKQVKRFDFPTFGGSHRIVDEQAIQERVSRCSIVRASNDKVVSSFDGIQGYSGPSSFFGSRTPKAGEVSYQTSPRDAEEICNIPPMPPERKGQETCEATEFKSYRELGCFAYGLDRKQDSITVKQSAPGEHAVAKIEDTEWPVGDLTSYKELGGLAYGLEKQEVGHTVTPTCASENAEDKIDGTKMPVQGFTMPQFLVPGGTLRIPGMPDLKLPTFSASKTDKTDQSVHEGEWAGDRTNWTLSSKAPTAEDISSFIDTYLSPALSGTLTVSDLRWLVGALLKQYV